MKKCTTCREGKLLINFNKNRTRNDGLQSVCRPCNKKRAKKYYEENCAHHKAVVYSRKRKILTQNQKRMCRLLSKNSCTDCGEANPLVLEFDHIKTKKHGVSKLLCEGYSWKRILEEISKCEIRCANCHNVKTHKENNSYRWKNFGQN